MGTKTTQLQPNLNAHFNFNLFQQKKNKKNSWPPRLFYTSFIPKTLNITIPQNQETLINELHGSSSASFLHPIIINFLSEFHNYNFSLHISVLTSTLVARVPLLLRRWGCHLAHTRKTKPLERELDWHHDSWSRRSIYPEACRRRNGQLAVRIDTKVQGRFGGNTRAVPSGIASIASANELQKWWNGNDFKYGLCHLLGWFYWGWDM